MIDDFFTLYDFVLILILLILSGILENNQLRGK